MTSEVKQDSNKKACLACQGVFSAELDTCPNDGTVLTDITQDAMIGTVLDDRYEILSVIGGGGMGMVYRARQRFINRMVAVKVLHKGSISSADVLKRFQLEAQAASQLSNPHIVTVFDSNVSKNGDPYMVMDYLEGQSLDGVLDAQGPLAVSRALNIFVQICDALAKAHAKGIVHRDIKPSNIVLVNEDGESDFVKIVDFGIAKILREGEAQTGNLTRTGEIFGSPHYMSPEQWRGGKLDARTDIYSLGAVMYRTLCGAPLYTCTDVLQLAYKHVQEMPPTMTSHGIILPEGLEAIVFQALAKECDERFQTMQELREKLVEVQKSLPARFVTPQVVPGGFSGLSSGAPDGSDQQAVSASTQEWLRELTPRMNAEKTGVVAGAVDSTVTGKSNTASAADDAAGVARKTSGLSSLGSASSNDHTVQLTIPKKSLKVGGIVAAVAAVAVGGAVVFSAMQHSNQPPTSIPPGTMPTVPAPATVVPPAPATVVPKAPAPAPVPHATAPPHVHEHVSKSPGYTTEKVHVRTVYTEKRSGGDGIKKVLKKWLRKL